MEIRKAKRGVFWAVFSGKIMIWPTIRRTKRDAIEAYGKGFGYAGTEARRITVLEGIW